MPNKRDDATSAYLRWHVYQKVEFFKLIYFMFFDHFDVLFVNYVLDIVVHNIFFFENIFIDFFIFISIH